MSGYKTWVGVLLGAVGALHAALGLDLLTTEQLSAIQMLSVSLIGVGLGSKADKAKKASDAVAAQTAMVANEVRKADIRIEPQLFVPDSQTGEPKTFVRNAVWPNK